LQLIELLARAAKRNRLPMKAGLTERPLNMDAVGFRPLHGRFV
jgi:hypothetical protein